MNYKKLIRFISLIVCIITVLFIDDLGKALDENFYKQNFYAYNVQKSHESNPIKIIVPSFTESAYEIIFDGLAIDDYFDNFFQTSNKNSLGLELQHPNKLILKIGNYDPVELNFKFELNKWYRFKLSGGISLPLKLEINGLLVYESSNPSVTKQLINFDNLIFGTGYEEKRPLQGAIRNASVNISGISVPPYKYIILFVVGLLCVLFALTQFRPYINKWSSICSKPIYYNKTELLVFCTIITVGGLTLIQQALLTGSSKWSLLLSIVTIGAAIVIYPKYLHRIFDRPYVFTISIILTVLVLISIVVLGPSHLQTQLKYNSLSILLPILIFVIYSQTLSKVREFSLPKAITLALATLLVSPIFYELQNWQLMQSSLIERPVWSIFVISFSGLFAFLILFKSCCSVPDTQLTKCANLLHKYLKFIPFIIRRFKFEVQR